MPKKILLLHAYLSVDIIHDKKWYMRAPECSRSSEMDQKYAKISLMLLKEINHNHITFASPV